MRKSILVLAVLAGTILQALPIRAADLPLQEPNAQAVGPADCGSCGCLRVNYIYHRELRTTYGTGFDPRNYDATEPHYYFGPVRPFPQYYVDGVPTTDESCWR